jgi:c-di-GMP-related signal transduction protein
MFAHYARQAIYNRKEEIIGYELLCRSSVLNKAPAVNGDRATMELLHRLLQTGGIEQATDGKLAFVNYTRNLLLGKIPLITPNDTGVVEILEDVRPERLVVEACRKLSERGYVIALDDFIYRRELEPLILLADIIKIDFHREARHIIERDVKRLAGYPAKLLAEKVETESELRIAFDLGFIYFQGHFFSQAESFSPQVPQGRLQLPCYRRGGGRLSAQNRWRVR